MSVFNAYMSLSGAIEADVLRDERLSRRTTYRIGGPAALLVCPHTYEALVKTLEVLREQRVEWVVMGRGSNVLVSDEGYRGCVILLGREFSHMSFSDDGHVSVGASLQLIKLVTETMRRSLSGLEFCVGIPGTVGGAISMNAGSRHEWISSVVESVVALRPGVGLVRHEASAIEWGYRASSLPTDEIILEAVLALRPGDHDAIAADIDERLRRRQQTQPVGKPCCGSVFRDPPDVAAGALIESCGLKGYRCGGASVSETHANFIVNDGGATAVDVVTVMSHVHDTVLSERGIDLRPEVKLLGFGE